LYCLVVLFVFLCAAFLRRPSYVILRPRERLRNIVMSMSVSLSVCLSVCLSVRISPEPHARSLANFWCMLLMWVARSSSDMFTISRIAYRREGVFSTLKIHHRPGKGMRVYNAGEVL